MEGEEGRGSARSVEGFDLYYALAQCTKHLEEFGGHSRAAGLSLARSKIDAFSEAFEEVVSNQLLEKDLHPTLHVDYEVQLDNLTDDLLAGLKRLEPFGADNRRPVFLLRGADIDGQPRRVGPDRSHLKFSVRCSKNRPLDAIGFGMGERTSELANGRVDVVFAFEENEFRGIRRSQLRLKDMREAAL